MRMKCKLIVGEKWFHKKLIAEYFARKVYEKLNSKQFRGEWGDVNVDLVCEDKSSNGVDNSAIALNLLVRAEEEMKLFTPTKGTVELIRDIKDYIQKISI
ncbi:unnamed protein product [marine sediment metagenome]|uniref:Uncharacterized protein n=1 Tax=marine sediment metagenome TaxID=412755 RepID=X1JFE2_9ZZZZ